MTRRGLLLVTLRVAVSLVLLVAVLTRANLGRTFQILGHSRLVFVAVGLLGAIAGVVISSAQWRVLLRSQGIRLGLGLVTRLYFFGYSFNAVLPTTIGGDAIKAAYVGQRSGHMVPAVGATVMARVVGFAVLLSTALVVSAGASIRVPAYGWSLTLVLVGLTVIFGAGLAVLRWAPSLVDRGGVARSRPLRPLVDTGHNLAGFTRDRPALTRAALLSLLFYATLNLDYFFYGAAVGLRSPFWFYWVAVPLLSIVTLIPVSLNGIGAREGGAVLLFRLAGDGAAGALSLALLVELQLLLFAVVGLALQPGVSKER